MTVRVIIAMLLGLFFLNIDLLFSKAPGSIASQINNMGYGTIALAVGLISELKQLKERYDLFLTQQRIPSSE